MEQQQKRNTDCVYFLASPLTCKKGNDCEYRHSHAARLNPRDCWYWLNGNCCNPNCVFRHPPVEGLNGVKTDTSQMHSHSVVPTSKSSVPCYFFFNAICTKGEQCPFLHDYCPAQKIMKAVPEATANHPPEKKISASSDTGPASVELPSNPPAETLHLIKQNLPTEVLQQSAPTNVLEEPSQSAESVVPEHEEPTDNSHHDLDFMNQNGQLSPYQSSEELMKLHVEPELDERWESSPGFDVLVDDGSEQLAYDDDGADYLLTQNGESELLHSQLIDYGFEGPADYDHARYHEEGYSYGPSHYHNCVHIEDGYFDDFAYQSSVVPNEERIFENGFDRKKKVMSRISSDLNARDDGRDLRDHLRKRKRMNAHRFPMNYRKRRVSRARGTSQERPMTRVAKFSNHFRLASEVGKSMITSSQDGESTIDDHHWQGQTGHTEISRFKRARLREQERRRRQWNSSSTSCDRHQSTDVNFWKSLEVHHNCFAGPKTLAEIKKEKNRDKESGRISGDYLQYRRKHETADFEGPKPLDELLKGKRRSENADVGMSVVKEFIKVGSLVEKRIDDAKMSFADKQEYTICYGKDGKYVGADDNDDIDDDIFQKKVALMLSN